MKAEKILLPSREHPGNVGIRTIQSIDKAAWIWHSPEERSEPEFVLFRCSFETVPGEELVIHVSADERYELYLDGRLISRGPDRSDVAHWTYASYRLSEASSDQPSEHIMEALVWRLQRKDTSAFDTSLAPRAQHAFRGGFILKADGPYHERLTTGAAPWKTAEAAGWECSPMDHPMCFGVGGVFTWRGGAGRLRDNWHDPVTVLGPVGDNDWGMTTAAWKLYPTRLPDQTCRTASCYSVVPGRVIAAGESAPDRQNPLPGDDLNSPACSGWNALLNRGQSLTLPARSRGYALWDLEDYYTAYPRLDIAGGQESAPGASLSLAWAESLYESRPGDNEWDRPFKGNRDETAGKFWIAMTDPVLRPLPEPTGESERTALLPSGTLIPGTLTIPWWRAGRYVLITWETGDEPLTMDKIVLEESRYPLENEGFFDTGSEPELPAITDICVRGMQMSAHETFTDCPYYEQLMYVGDTRLELLTMYVMTGDDRLAKRCIELFDYSRVNWGFVNERYPSSFPQNSPTFSLIWVLMLGDFAFWRDDDNFVKARMVGMRAMMEHFAPNVNRDGLLEALPGWPFTDWTWEGGVPAGGWDGVSGPVNLLYVLSLQAAARLERMHGEELMADRYEGKANRAAQALMRLFWDEERGLFSDTLLSEGMPEYSEHGQALALLGGIGSADQRERIIDALENDRDLRPCSSYFSFYLFEALAKEGRTEIFQKRLDLWKEMVAKGCRAPLESPEPSRSDCHAWSSQPLYHLYASVAGVRPSAPGFGEVRIEPLPGIWEGFNCEMPHPRGVIKVTFEKGELKAELPENVKGTLVWKGEEKEI